MFSITTQYSQFESDAASTITLSINAYDPLMENNEFEKASSLL